MAVVHVEIVERFLNQIGVLVSHMAKLWSGNSDVHDPIAGVAVTRGLEPGVV
jgi:hypothetical protein